jgi:hypothetical protein
MCKRFMIEVKHSRQKYVQEVHDRGEAQQIDVLK